MNAAPNAAIVPGSGDLILRLRVPHTGTTADAGMLVDTKIGVTNWMVLPARRFIPGLFGHDLASVLLAWFWQLVYLLAAAALSLARSSTSDPERRQSRSTSGKTSTSARTSTSTSRNDANIALRSPTER